MAAEPARRVRLRFGAASDAGRVRSNNQDSFLAQPDQALYVVADGMGGHQGGEVASSIAVQVIREQYDDPTRGALVEAVERANAVIHDRGASEPTLRGMGTTAVVAALIDTGAATTSAAGTAAADDPDAGGPPDGDDDHRSGTTVDRTGETPASDAGGAQQVLIANIGDSRAYLYRQGEVIQLTEDHSMVADLVRDGRISEEEAEHHPQRNILTRVLGVYEEIEVDVWPVDPARGDRFVLCSDGLFNELDEDQIGAVLRRLDDPEEAAAELVRLANDAGGHDNITVLVLDVVDDGGAAETASAAVGGSAAAAIEAPATDVAGFTTSLDPEDLERVAVESTPTAPNPALAAADGDQKLISVRALRERRQRRRRSGRDEPVEGATPDRTRFTWRFALVALLVLAIVGGALLTIQWYGTSTYHVAFAGDEVAIFKGRPGGLLWINPELVDRSGLERDEVPPQYDDALASGQEYSSLAGARAFVDNIRSETTTTTTTPTTTTTTEAERPTNRGPASPSTTERPSSLSGRRPSTTVDRPDALGGDDGDAGDDSAGSTRG